MAEWLKALVLKTSSSSRGSWVRIPLLPLQDGTVRTLESQLVSKASALSRGLSVRLGPVPLLSVPNNMVEAIQVAP